jgi:hypothetical protein
VILSKCNVMQRAIPATVRQVISHTSTLRNQQVTPLTDCFNSVVGAGAAGAFLAIGNHTKETAMNATKSISMLSVAAALAAALPAYAQRTEPVRHARPHAHTVVRDVQPRRVTVVQRPVVVQRTVVVQRPVVVHRPVTVARPVYVAPPAYSSAYGNHGNYYGNYYRNYGNYYRNYWNYYRNYWAYYWNYWTYWDRWNYWS